MKVLSVSDIVVSDLLTPNCLKQLKDIDLILACGDLPPEYLYELRNRYEVPLFYILGNHDIRHESSPAGCINISGRIVHQHGFSFLGFSGSRWYNGNPNQYREHQMRSQIRKLWVRLFFLKRLDVVITHAPPRYINDAEDRCHRGFKSFHLLLSRHTPTYFIHGHIHRSFKSESDRITLTGSTKVVNSYGHYIFTL